MSNDLYQEIQEHLKEIKPETPAGKVREIMESFVFKFARLDGVRFERLWADHKERLNLKGPYFTELRRKIKETREKLKKGKPVKENPDLSPEEELKKLKILAEPLVQCPGILAEVVGVLKCLGLAGQEREAKIIYLALTSRIFERPVNVAVKGPSSGGKSFLVEQCLSLFPKSAYYALSAMSERALAYSQEPMSHRHLVIYEAAGLGGEISQYLMRSLLSEGRIRYETTDTSGKEAKGRLIEREGPTGLIVTTTRAGLHPENETRLLSLEVDDSPKQTRSVLLAHAKNEKPKAVDLAPFQALQRILEIELPQVVVPYAEPLALGCNTAAIRLRRDFPMVLILIRSHAALHFHHRLKDEYGRIVATFDDYKAVYDLVGDLIACCTGHKISETVRETVEAVKNLGGVDLYTDISVQELAEQLKRDKSTALRRAKVALRAGYLVNMELREHAPYRLILGQPLPDNQTVLPPPDKIKENLNPSKTDASLQPNKELGAILDNYVLQPSLHTFCNLQPPKSEMYSCTSEIHTATADATDNYKESFAKEPRVAELHEESGGIEEKNSIFNEEEDLERGIL